MELSFTEINHLIKSLDYNWLQQFVDEENYESEEEGPTPVSSKLLIPTQLRSLIINVENILNFMQQSVKVYSVNTKSFKEWDVFGKLLKDLIKLKEVYEPHAGELTSALINNRINFAKSVMKWITESEVIFNKE